MLLLLPSSSSLLLCYSNSFFLFVWTAVLVLQREHFWLFCASKNILNIFSRNFKTDCPILIIFGTNISETTGHQTTISVFHLIQCLYLHFLEKTEPTKYYFFYPMRYDYLINITHKNRFCSHFWHCGWHFIQLSIFQLPAVKLLRPKCWLLANTNNTSKETFSPFIDSSIDNVLLQTNLGFISRFLTLQCVLNFIW